MKKGLLILLLFCSVFADAQSLKDALFSGKLKVGTGTVVRKGDDVQAIIDSTAAADSVRKVVADSLTRDSIAKVLMVQPDSVAGKAAVDSVMQVMQAGKDSIAARTTLPANPDPADTTASVGEPATPAAPAKDNNDRWKEYVDTVSNTIKTEALPNKKVKKGTYYATVSYTIETTGQVEVNDVFLSPENDYLRDQIKSRLALEAPRLTPVLNSAGTPRKVTRKYNFTLTKE